MTPLLWIVTGTALSFMGSALLIVGLDGEDWALYGSWPVLYAASIVTLVGVIGAGVAIGRK